MPTVERITLNDVARAGHCIKGARAWFEQYGFVWRDVVKHGVSVEAFRATGDALAERVIVATEARAHG